MSHWLSSIPHIRITNHYFLLCRRLSSKHEFTVPLFDQIENRLLNVTPSKSVFVLKLQKQQIKMLDFLFQACFFFKLSCSEHWAKFYDFNLRRKRNDRINKSRCANETINQSSNEVDVSKCRSPSAFNTEQNTCTRYNWIQKARYQKCKTTKNTNGRLYDKITTTGHVITGDLNIVNNTSIPASVLSKTPIIASLSPSFKPQSH